VGGKKLFHNLIAGVNPTAAGKRERRFNPTAAGKGEGRITSTRGAQLEFTI
jgi:hypothetical protein